MQLGPGCGRHERLHRRGLRLRRSLLQQGEPRGRRSGMHARRYPRRLLRLRRRRVHGRRSLLRNRRPRHQAMMPQRRHSAPLLVAAAFAAVAAFTLYRTEPASAVISGSPCPGNVCTGSIVIGGQAVTYAYTQHLSSNGQFRIRLNGGTYGTSSLVSFIVYDVPVFSSTGYLANPTNGAQAMTEVDVNPGNTAYERRDSDGCASCIYDHVMSLNYVGLAPGAYTFSFTVVQNGDSGG